MDLHHTLASIRTLPDLSHLIQALGLAPLWDKIPPDAWPGWRSSHRPNAAVVAIARVGDFPWFALEEADAPRSARAIAHRLAARGRVAGVFVLDPATRTLAVTLAFGTIPVVQIDLNTPDRAAAASLARLSGTAAGGTLGYAARVADALSAERVGHRFFREFRATLGKIAGALPASIRLQDRHDFALLQLTRVLFLYFVQSRGWLAERERFLGEEVDRCLASGRQVHRDLLRPLFFGTLNRPAAERTRAVTEFGSIPFLNGGLFEPHALERKYRIDIPNPFWRDAFDELFEGFHFTIAERDRRGAVAPDMLGRVFEGVMDPDVRRSTGTFYTPTALVDRLIDAGFVAFVAERLRCGEREAVQRLREGEPNTIALLDTVTILDPAVGSGAFLLGALEQLARLGGTPSAARKRRILQRNLFGVDRSPTAVRLAELRLWLAIVADDTTERPHDVAPLPNLDCLIRQGDSLFDPVTPRAGASRTQSCRASDLTVLRERTITASGAAKSAATRRLRAAELEMLAASLTDTESRIRAEISECIRDARTRDLFGIRRGTDRALVRQLHQLRSELRETRRARRRVHDGDIPWFHYQGHFADVFARTGGFDMVVGNPPWQRAETIAAAARQRLSGRYRWWRSGGRGYGNRPDLAVAFLERAFELAAPGGVVSMLIPAKLASASYGASARHALASETTLRAIANLSGDHTASFDATVYPLAIVAAKASAPPEQHVRTTLELSTPTIKQARLTGGGPWLLLPDRHRQALAMLQADHPRLDAHFTCQLGVKTGANAVFLRPPADLEAEVLRWAVRGRDVKPFGVTPSIRLLWTHDRQGHPHAALPRRAAAYLRPHLATLRQRADFTSGIPWVLFRVGAATKRYRVVWPDLARQLTAAALVGSADRERIPLNTCYVVSASSALEAECLTAWLNSTWMRVAARAIAVPASGGFARFNAAAVGALPLPAAAIRDAELASLARTGHTGIDVQARVDEVAAGHLGLSVRGQTSIRSLFHAQSNDRR